MPTTIGDLITQSLTEIRVARAGDTLSAEDMALGVYVYNRILNQWNGNPRAAYSEAFTDYTLIASLSPHTIGPSGQTFTATIRPERILNASINIGSNVHIPITVRDANWYARQSSPAVTESVPTDLYYKPDWPNGRLYFYGVPSTAYTVRLWTETLIATVVQTDTFSMPPGYQTALELTGAEELAPSFGQSIGASLERRAREARALLWGNNDKVPQLVTCDAGLNIGGFQDIDYRTRRLR